MTIKDLLDSLYSKMDGIDVEEYAPLSPIEKWEKFVGYMDQSMKLLYARIVQLTLTCEEVSTQLSHDAFSSKGKQKKKKNELKLARLNREILLHEVLLELLLFDSFPEVGDHSFLESRRGWKLVALPPPEAALSPEERYQIFVVEPLSQETMH